MDRKVRVETKGLARKTCPVCGSTRLRGGERGYTCQKCGYEYRRDFRLRPPNEL